MRFRWIRWAAILFLIVGAGVILRDCWPHRTTRYLVDADNRIVIYHGVNLANHAKSTPDRLPKSSLDDFRLLRDLGFNLVRYLVFWEAIEPEPGKINQEYLDATLKRIDQLGALGIDVLIDFHQDLYAQRFGGNGFPDWTVNDGGLAFERQTPWQNNYWQPAVWHSYDAFWRNPVLQDSYAEAIMAVLGRVVDRTNVIGVDIINEPWPWRGFGFERHALTDFYAQVAKKRDQEGFRIPLYFAPMLPTNAGFRSGLQVAPADDSVYSIHYYDAMMDFGFAYRWWNRWWMWRSIRVKVGEAERMGVPLFVGEFGISPNNPGFKSYLRDLTELLENHHVGWAYWSYDAGQFGFLNSKGRPGPALDILVQMYPQRIAGRNLNITRTERSLMVSYDPVPTDAPTLIFIPSRLEVDRVVINGQPVPLPIGQLLEHRNPNTTERQTILITTIAPPRER